MATNKTITVTTVSTVTGDTLDSYNAYSDIDGLLGSLSVAEAAAGKVFALSDGVTHSVTVKPVGTSNGEFSSVSSNAVSIDLTNGVLFSDDFAGTTIDTGKWTLTNPDTGSVVGSQNDKFIFTCLDADASIPGAYDNKLESVSTFDASGTIVVKWDQSDDSGLNNVEQFSAVSLHDGASNDIILLTRSQAALSTPRVATRCFDAGTQVLAETPHSTVNFTNSFKIVKATNGDVSWWYWSGAAWTQLGSTLSTGITSGNLYLRINQGDSNTNYPSTPDQLNVKSYDNVFVTDTDFATLNPA